MSYSELQTNPPDPVDKFRTHYLKVRHHESRLRQHDERRTVDHQAGIFRQHNPPFVVRAVS